MTQSSPASSNPSSSRNKVGIIGNGYVGKSMLKIFPEALVYSPHLEHGSTKEEINRECGLAIICVPTPPLGMNEQKVDPGEEQFRSVDLSIVEETIAWLQTPLILIKSTVPPGTTEQLAMRYGKNICFSPEYVGEGNYYTPPRYPDPEDPRKHDFMIIGGFPADCDAILAYFVEKLGPAKHYYKCSDTEAECIKYMENTWGAMKVTFMNEWFEMCQRFGASFNSVREGFILDSRVEPMHTMVFPTKRGFSGKCFPKDLLGIIARSEAEGYEPKLLKQVWETNREMLKKNER